MFRADNSPERTIDMSEQEMIQFIGWGGVYKTRPVTWDLGVTTKPLSGKPFGLRRVVWDLCYGVVNGFPFRDVLYYVLTRSFSKRICLRVLDWEERKRA